MTWWLRWAVVAGCLAASHAWLFNFGGSQRQQAVGLISEECERKAARGDCTFYVCFDQRHACDHHNYALSYGWRFCNGLDTHWDRFTPKARKWVNSTRVCAMQRLVPFYRASHINCGDVQSEMREAHAECEAEHGACDREMLMSNKDALMDVYDFNRKVLIRFLSVIKECSAASGSEFIDWVREQRRSMMSYFRRVAERVASLGEELEDLRASLPDIELPDIDFSDIELPDIDLSGLDLPGLGHLRRLPEPEEVKEEEPGE